MLHWTNFIPIVTFEYYLSLRQFVKTLPQISYMAAINTDRSAIVQSIMLYCNAMKYMRFLKIK